MFERFTDRARKVFAFANQEAQRFNHEYIGTEHILLGLVKEDSGVVANVLKNLGLNKKMVRLEVEKLVKPGPDTLISMGNLPQTPRTKKVIEYTIKESRDLNHNYIDTEHILLGLIREEDGIATKVLTNLGLDLAEIRRQTLILADTSKKSPAETEKEQKKCYEKCKIFRINTSPSKTEAKVNQFIETGVEIIQRLASTETIILFYKDKGDSS